MRAFFRLVATVVQLVVWVLAEALSALFGRLRWNPPPWISWPFGQARRGVRALRGNAGVWRKSRPLAFYGGILAVLALIGGGVFGYRWYKSLPEPVRLTMSVQAPAAQPILYELPPTALVVTFSGSAARLEDVGKGVDKGIELDPPLPGTWTWTSDKILTFNPAKEWAIGKEYALSFEKRLFPRHVLLEKYKTTFATPKFDGTFKRTEFYQDPTDAKKKVLSLEIEYSQPVERKSLEKGVRIVRPAKRADGSENGPGKDELKAILTYADKDSRAFITSEDLTLPERDTEYEVTVGPDVVAAKGSDGAPVLKTIIVAPAIGSFFKFTGTDANYVRRNDTGELVPVITVSMSGRVKPKQLEDVIEAWVLPRDRPALKDDPKSHVIKDYGWYSRSEVSPEALGLGRKLTLKIDGDQGTEPVESVAFRHDAKPGEHVFLRVKRGLEAFGGYILADTWEAVLPVPPIPTELKVLHPGAILSMQGEKKLTIVSRGVPGVKARIGRVAPDRINMLISQTRGDFSSPAFKSYQFGKDDLVERFVEKHELDATDAAKPQYYGLDLEPYLTRTTGASPSSPKKGLFFVDIDEWDPQANQAADDQAVKDEPNRRGRDARFILVTDLGLVVKDNADRSHDVFVMRLHTGVPGAGVEVSILGRNGIPLAIRTTGADGRVSFPSLEGFAHEEEPVAWIARESGDVSFLPFAREDRRLYLGRFDIGGETTAGKADTLDAYLFSDRGLYRPGDTAHLSTIVKTYGFAPLPAGLPLELVISDPRGLEIDRRLFSPGKSGFDEHTFTTQETSPTGAYQVALYTVKDTHRDALLGSTSIKVEEFLPDRLKIGAKLSRSSDAGWVKPDDLSATVSLKNLYGTPAVGHRITASYALAPASPRLPGFEAWRFLSLDAATEGREEALGDLTTDAEGEATYNLPLSQYAAKTYRLTFTAEGFELAGGRAVVGKASTVISPRDFLIGVKADGDLNYIRQGTERNVNIVAVGPDAKAVAATGLTGVLSERRWISTLVKGEDGLYRYRSTEATTQLSEAPLALPVAGFTYKVPAGKAGTFLYQVKNAGGEILADFTFDVAGSGALSRGLERNAELTVRLAKADAAPGEEIEMEIRAPYTGAGLITIERDKVYAAKWFKADHATSIQRITLPAGIEGNAYVHVAFVRAADSRELYASPLSYGVAPFTVSRKLRTIALELKAPDKTRPQDPLEVDVRPDRPTRLVVYGVDEGILQVAHYKTPDPLSHFLRKRALEVTTRQILDQILPEYSVALKAAAGGDGDDSLARNLNPFRRKTLAPAVVWSGIVDAGPEGKHFSFKLPSHFNGTVRLMAVAVSDDAIGVAEQRVLRQGAFVLSPVSPLFVAPGDEFAASVAVANNLAGSGKGAQVQVSLKPTGGIAVVGEQVVTVPIDEGREGVATFKLKATADLGEATLAFGAKKDAEEVGYAETLSVRPATPYEVQIAAKRIDGGSESFDVERDIHAAYRTLESSVSLLPLGLAHGLMTYLENYPHGCSEQVLSQAFPSIILADFPGYALPAEKARAAVAHASQVLSSRQNADGSIGYWAANADVVNFQQAYALHFLLEVRARKLGGVDATLARLEKFVEARVVTGDPRASIGAARDLAYMAYALARDDQLGANALSRLRDVFEKNLPKGWHEDSTAAFLAAAMKLRRDDDAAAKLFKQVKLDGESTNDYDFYYDGYLRVAQVLFIAAKHFPDRLPDYDGKAVEKLTELVTKERYNTLSSSWAILALEAYSKAAGTPKEAHVAVVNRDKAGAKTPQAMPDGSFPVLPFGPEVRRVDVDAGDAKTPVFTAVTTAGFDLEGTRKPEEKGVEVFRELTDDKGNAVKSVKVGDEVTVTLAIRGIDGDTRNLAIVDLLPGGFELIFDSFAGHGRAAAPEEPPSAQDDGAPAPHEQEQEPQDDGAPGHEDYEEGPQDGDQQEGVIDWFRGLGAAYAAGAADAAQPFTPDHLDLREDRVIIYGSASKDVKAFRYKIRAASPGTYIVPAAYAHSMYQREVRTRGKQASIVIEAK